MKQLDLQLLTQNIDQIARYDFDRNKIFGSAYYVCQGQTALTKCYGTGSAQSDLPITDSTLFRLASMTKPITAAATLILVDRGLLSLDDPISQYLPSFADIHVITANGNDLGRPRRQPLIRDLLTHTSGIGSDPIKHQAMTAEDKQTLDASIEYYIRVGLDFEPGSQQLYSGVGAFDVMVKIIELIVGTDYLTFLKHEIFAPCGMEDTTFEPSPQQWQRLAAMHANVDGKNTHRIMPTDCIFEDYPCTHYLGGAGLVSSLRDYSRFAKMFLNNGRTSQTQLISEDTFRLLRTPQVSRQIMPGTERWGLGVRVITEDSSPYLPVGTFGWSGAYGSHFWVDPENELIAVYMKNSQVDGGAGNESARKFEEAVYRSLRS